MSRNWSYLRLAPILLGLAAAGCSGLLRSDAPPVQVYTLQAAAPSGGTADPHPAVAASLRVAHPLAAPGLGTAQIVLLQPDHRMSVYAASAWAADAPALIESLATQTLRGADEWSSVTAAESPFPSDYLLQISIRRFDADYSAGTEAPPTVHVTLDCTLGAEEGRAVVASFVAAGSAAAGANKLSEVVAAFQQATDQALASLSQQAFAGARVASSRRAGSGTP
ncbi:MAG TPA: ABC-type transport auxiliary lipoprotein family protein [Steroidobacteraceae bacterium]|jgi:cholesterol transport system auxiliary component|nr:ABC-type transport auxiliary lipoprotein family protein [Steroidobacteraceae bacterium]